MSAIHMRQIKATLERTFDGLVDISDYVNKPESEREKAFLTRSLAALSLMIIADIEAEDAADAVTDGGQDNGIDAVYYHRTERVLYLAQSKWRHDGKGSIGRGEVQKFVTGFRDLVNARFERFNEKVRAKRTLIETALNDARTRISLLIAYTGQEPLSDDVSRDLNDLLEEMNDPVEVLTVKTLRQVNIYSAIAQGIKGSPIELEVILYDWGQKREPYQAYYGQVAASDVADWWHNHFPRLFSPNIRMFLGETDVNESLIATLENAPERFWYFNNGITALCASVEKKPLGGSTRDTGVFECHDFRIVNGAQTAGAIAAAAHRRQEEVASARVPIRVISLEQCPEDFDREVTRYNNTQNRIERRDFVALDVEQERIKNELLLEGVVYAYKSGETISPSERGFDLVEATVARACAQGDVSFAVQAKREIGKLWEDIERSPYQVLFNPTVSGPELWKLVQILRVVEDVLSKEKKGREGRERLLAIHGNRFIAHLVFQRLPEPVEDAGSELHDNARLVLGNTATRVYEQALDAINDLYPDAYLASLFKNLTKCREVRNTLVEVMPSHPMQHELL